MESFRWISPKNSRVVPVLVKQDPEKKPSPNHVTMMCSMTIIMWMGNDKQEERQRMEENCFREMNLWFYK